MPRWLSIPQPLRQLALLVLLLPVVARAQVPAHLRTLWYDSARTQRRAVYGVQLRGPRPDAVAHGPFRRFARNGALEELGHFTDGQADSIWTRYYAPAAGCPAALARRLPMRAGQPDGPFVVFHPDGRVAQRGTFRQGRLVDSLATTNKTGRPRLLARFDSSRGPGLRGTFRQWGGQYTAQTLRITDSSLTDDNPYPQANPGRYWTGQLVGGRLVGSFIENDPNGQPRIRLLFDPAGRLQVVTSYYPSLWRRHELLAQGDSSGALQAGSLPFRERRAVGPQPYLLERTWDWETDSTLGTGQLLQAVGEPRHPGLPRGDAACQRPFTRPDAGALMSLVSQVASFWVVVPRRALPGALPAAHPRQVPFARPAFNLVTGQLPVPYAEQYWRVGTTDTLSGRYQQGPRRELRYPSGQLAAVEKPHGYQTFAPTGQLREKEHLKKNGIMVRRQYQPDGRLRRKTWIFEGESTFARQRNRNGRMPLFRSRVHNAGFR